MLELEAFEAEVRSGAIRPATLVQVPPVTGEAWVPARDLELFARLHVPARIRFARRFSLGRFPTLTAALCVLQVVMFFVVSGGERVLGLDALVRAGAKVGANVVELGETWRLLSANVLHRDLLHLGFNTFFLFNVGGPVENAFRQRDYVWILVVSGLGTTICSLLMSPVPSVGASGIVLGLFGSASVFGYRYGDLLPRRYRRYFGGAVLPYGLFIIYLGFTTPDTDNWGHVGGFVAGALATLGLTPKLLLDERRGWTRSWSLFAAAGLVLLVVGAGPMARGRLVVFTDVLAPEGGLQLRRPLRWDEGVDHLGNRAWGNRLGVSIGLRVLPGDDRPVKEGRNRSEFLAELEAREAAGDIASVRLRSERPFLIEGGSGVEVVAELESRAGPQRTRNLLIQRGYHAYWVVVTTPVAWAGPYADLVEELVEGIQLVEPPALREARRLAETFPGMSSAQAAYARELAQVGELEAAARRYQRALGSVPDHPEAVFGLAKLALDFGGELEAAEAAMDLQWRADPTTERSVLLADLRTRLGRRDAACDVLSRRGGGPPPEPIAERLRALRCPFVPWSE